MFQEAITFIRKAKRKVFDIGNATIENDNDDDLELAMELIRIIRALESPYNNWSESDILRYIHYYNVKAKLNRVPVASFINVNWGLCGCNDQEGTSGPHKHYVVDIIDFKEKFIELFKTMQHDDLQGIKGPGTTHIDEALLACITASCKVKGIGTVALNLSKSNSVLYEKAVNIAPVTLMGSITLANGEEHLASRYYRGNVLIDSPKPLTAKVVTEVINDNTTFTFQADFRDSGTKSASKSFRFAGPSHWGILPVNATLEQIQQLPKQMLDGPRALEIAFSHVNDLPPVPGQVQILSDPGYPKPVFMHQASLGEAKTISVGGIDTKQAWRVFRGTLPLNGTTLTEDYIAYQWIGPYNEAFNYVFSWQ
jgi:hypothetical protein